MQDKHKVTLYLPPELHRQLKIRSALEFEAMSAIAERALVFYLTHSEIVDEVESAHGHAHQLYSCPKCSTPLVLRDGEMVAVGEQLGVSIDDSSVGHLVEVNPEQQGEEQLVPC
jgi:hypothetical protein